MKTGLKLHAQHEREKRVAKRAAARAVRVSLPSSEGVFLAEEEEEVENYFMDAGGVDDNVEASYLL